MHIPLPRSSHVASLLVILTVGLCLPVEVPADDQRVDYRRDIRPILSNHCYICHGPDEAERQTEWRLDLREAALDELALGGFAIVPGDSTKSELYKRISAKDAHARMPPADSGSTLTPEQIELIRTWIDQGAEWQEHWAFVSPERPSLPVLDEEQEKPARNSIDGFIFDRLQQEGLAPSPEADKTTLIRRVTFDLTGLPPTPEEVDAFLADGSPDAYERLVDRLLDSPRYGEHRARYWLDAARYGDTHGLHLDNERSIWPYRDWVIDAFNRNLPFDQFTVEQLAGDLLPEPALEQQLATGFNRCNVTTSEGGSINEEYRVRYAVDRVETTSTVWMGLTVGCAACHDHKYDPISQAEFYQLFAYFGNTSDRPMDGNALLPPPAVEVPTPEQTARREQYRGQIAQLEQAIQEKLAGIEYDEPRPSKGEAAEDQPQPREIIWIDDELPSGAAPQGNEGAESWQWVTEPAYPVFSGKRSHMRTAEGLSQHFFTSADPALTVSAGDKLFAHVYLDPNNPPQTIMLQFNDGSWEHRAYWGENRIAWGRDKSPSRQPMGPLPEAGTWVRLEVDAEAVGLEEGAELHGWAFTQFDGTVYWDQAGVVTSEQPPEHFESQLAWEQSVQSREESDLPEPILEIIKLEAGERDDDQTRRLRDYFVEHIWTQSRELFDPLHEQMDEVNKQLEELEKAIPSTMVMQEQTETRVDTFVLVRGEYDQPDKDRKVEPGVPAILPPLPEDAEPNRLALAKWLVDPSHPLTARVTVNRFWQQFFGTGLVKSAEDFGLQGEWPSHPELLDWLATEFVDSGWDVKHMHKLIVMSGTYRQSSHVTSELYRKDPDNRLLARGPRFRMDAEMVRDNALAVSGLLVERLGGRSVRPYQPPGLWEAVGYPSSTTAKFTQDHGDALYRRSMYTFWKRTSPPPSLSTFDAPSRENCTVTRPRTNTPLQALVLMNDVQYVEAARHLAERMMTEAGESAEERIAYAFRLATARPPDTDETAVLIDTYRIHLDKYRSDTEAAQKLLSRGESPRNESLDMSELAAWTMIAHLILNLDETITKG